MTSPASSDLNLLDRGRRAGKGAGERETDPPLELRRELGGWGTAALVVGVMIGTGIYLKPSEMAREAGSVELVFLAWVAGAVLALLGSLTYAELAAAIPETGGSYAYLRRAFGPVWGFLYGWRGIMVSTPASLAAYGAGIALFLGFLWPGVTGPVAAWDIGIPFRDGSYHVELRWSQVLGALLIVGFAVVNYLRVRHVGRLQIALTVIKTGALVAVIGIGLWFILTKSGSVGTTGSGDPPAIRAPSLGGFMAAVTAALWAYSGWHQVVRLGGEVRNPARTLPRAMIGGFLFTATLFIGVNFCYFGVLSFEGVASSRHVASDMLLPAVGPGVAGFLTIAMIVSVLGTMNATILSSSRVPYAMARDGIFFSVLAKVHPERRVPSAAVTLMAVMGIALVLTGTFEDLTALMIFSSWTFHGLGALALFRLRRLEPDLPRPYRAWGYPLVPGLFGLLSVILSVSIFLQRPVRSGIGLGVILLGIPVYRVWSRRREAPRETADHL